MQKERFLFVSLTSIVGFLLMMCGQIIAGFGLEFHDMQIMVLGGMVCSTSAAFAIVSMICDDMNQRT